jgi:hypothetical protein
MSIAPGGVVIVPDSVVGPTAFDIDAKLIVDFDGDGYVDIGTTTRADCHILRGADRVRHGNVALPHGTRIVLPWRPTIVLQSPSARAVWNVLVNSIGTPIWTTQTG